MNQQEEFTQLYRQYSPGILKLCMGYTGDAAQAEDLLQEAFVAVWRNMSRFRGDAAWGTWIYRIAVNTCLSHLRKKKLPTVSLEQLPQVGAIEKLTTIEQDLQILYKCISRLPEADRLIISLVLEDKPYEEIAQIIGISLNNLRVKIHRIKKQLTEIYNSHERV